MGGAVEPRSGESAGDAEVRPQAEDTGGLLSVI